MNRKGNIVKRWMAGVLAVTMLSSVTGAPVFAAPESTGTSDTVETARVTAWSWTDALGLTQQEDTSSWTLSLSEEQTLSTADDLLALLPVSVEATVARTEPEATATPAPDSAAASDTEATEAQEGAAASTSDAESESSSDSAPASETPTPAAASQPSSSGTPAAATETLTLTWDTSALTFPLASGDYTVTAALPDGYVLAESAPALAVAVTIPSTQSESDASDVTEDAQIPPANNAIQNAPQANQPSLLANGTANPIQTVTPVGTTINLFDYWFSDPNEETSDFKNYELVQAGSVLGIPIFEWSDYSTTNWCTGINQNHVLKFTPYTGTTAGESLIYGDKNNPIAKANLYTDSEKPHTGIVAKKLQGGFPVLSNTEDVRDSVADEGENYEKIDYSESLAYLFDPGADTNYRAVYTNVGGLLKVDEDTGYYTYDSSENYAYFQKDKNGSGSFTVYDTAGEGFFPFNSYGTVSKESDQKIWNANHFFGLTMTTQFIQPANGETTDGKAVTYHFAGDDDVWVFIDGVLVGDLGGIHNKADLIIDFQSGEVKVNGERKGTLKSLFDAAGEDVTSGFTNDTFADGSYHTLQLFYLERGANSSNLTLEFNLVSAPESTIRSVNQNGNGVNGTQFTLYSADQNYTSTSLTQIATGATQSEGRLVLRDSDDNNIGLHDLWNTLEQAGLVYDDGAGRKRANLVLNQTLPDGYRGADTIRLYLLMSGQNILLLSDNTWDTGAYAYSNSTISMNGDFEYGNSNTANLKTNGGTMFAVVLRRNINNTPQTDNWYMLTGSATEGWNQATQAVNNNVAAVLSEYQDHPNNFYQMELSASGGYEVTVSDLPGDITKYYYILDNNNKNQAEYNLAFYYTTAGSIADASSSNTWMVNNTGNWTRIFSTDVYVATIKNRLLIQQLDPNGNPMTGATFALYGSDYYSAAGQVNTDAQPVGTMTTTNLTKNDQGIELNGAALYPTGNAILEKGTYYLVQTGAPEGYETNTQATKVIVDDTGVYADAGTQDDDIQVARGVGSVVKSLAEFASSPDIDATLSNIVAKFYTVDSLTGDNFDNFVWRNWDNGTFTEASGVTYHPSYWYSNGSYSLAGVGEKPDGAQELGMHMEYGTSAAILEYGPGQDILDDLNADALYWMVTDAGWSNLMIEQCTEHSTALQQQGRAYQDLTGKDLTNLFSRSVVVRVTDQVQTCKLTVSNVVSDPIGNDNNQPFTVQIDLTKGSTADLAEKYSYTGGVLQDSGASAPANGDLEVAAGTVTLTSGQAITLEGVPYGTQFTIMATAENYTASYTVTAGDISPLAGDASANGTLKGDTTVAISNTRKTGSVSLTQNVRGPMGSSSDAFSYTLNLYDTAADSSKPAINGTYQATLTPKEGTAQAVSVTFTNGKATEIVPASGTGQAISLKDGDVLAIADLPAGSVCEVTEAENHLGYTTTVGNQAALSGTVTVPAGTSAASITFINTRAEITPTGLREENTPYIAMIGLSGLAALVGAAGWVEMRRRKRREEE